MKTFNTFMLFRDNKYWHEGGSVKFLELYDKKCQIDFVKISEDNSGNPKYFAWWDNETESFMYVWPSKGLVSMCFPYGSKAQEDLGKGVLLGVTIEKLKIAKKSVV